MKTKKTQNILLGLRDITVIAVVIIAISAWQSRHLLDADGTVEFENIFLGSLSGGSKYLLSDEKQTLVYFFAPWCNICSLSIGNLEYLNAENINIVTVAMDYQSVEEVQNFVENNQVNNSVLLGTHDLKRTFKINGYPTYYVINKKSQVISSSYGYSSALGLKLSHFFNSQA